MKRGPHLVISHVAVLFLLGLHGDGLAQIPAQAIEADALNEPSSETNERRQFFRL